MLLTEELLLLMLVVSPASVSGERFANAAANPFILSLSSLIFGLMLDSLLVSGGVKDIGDGTGSACALLPKRSPNKVPGFLV